MPEAEEAGLEVEEGGVARRSGAPLTGEARESAWNRPANLLSERRRAEQKVRRVDRQVERRVLERTRELEDTTQELAAFVNSVSHDLRAPVRGMIGLTEILTTDHTRELSPVASQTLRMITEQALKLDRMLSALLALSQIGRQRLELEVVDTAALVRGVVGELDCTGQDVRFTLGMLPHATGDPSLLAILFSNLLENAVKFTRGVTPTLIEVGSEGGEDGWPVFYVRDNGVGFDMRQADKLFGPFQRLHPESEFPGTGIGLATARHIVERHGGRISADVSAVGGTTFRFTLLGHEPR